MLIFSIVMIPLAVLSCISLVFTIGVLADIPLTHDQEGDQPGNNLEPVFPVDLVQLR